ncbi:MAG: deoxyribose-phosphate aldolase [Acidobacteriota bacterium]
MSRLKDLASQIDSTLLRADADAGDIVECARYARSEGCAAVCVAPTRARDAATVLRGGGTRLAVAIAFPGGSASVATKCFAALEALHHGAQELDVVCDLAQVRRGAVKHLEREIGEIMARTPEAIHKFILEVAWLPRGAWKPLGRMIRRLKPAFVKTGTGVNAGPVTEMQVARLRDLVGPETGIKAAGGIRTRETAERLLAAGATRLGTSSAASVLAGPMAGE